MATMVAAVLWLSGSAAWASGLTGLKSVTNPDNFFKYIPHVCANEAVAKCSTVFAGNFAGLNISIVSPAPLSVKLSNAPFYYCHWVKPGQSWLNTLGRVAVKFETRSMTFSLFRSTDFYKLHKRIKWSNLIFFILIVILLFFR